MDSALIRVHLPAGGELHLSSGAQVAAAVSSRGPRKLAVGSIPAHSPLPRVCPPLALISAHTSSAVDSLKAKSEFTLNRLQ